MNINKTSITCNNFNNTPKELQKKDHYSKDVPFELFFTNLSPQKEKKQSEKLTSEIDIIDDTKISTKIFDGNISLKENKFTTKRVQEREDFFKSGIKEVKIEYDGGDFEIEQTYVPPPLYDENRLIAGRYLLGKKKQENLAILEPIHFGWHLNLAIASLPEMEALDEDTKKKIEFIKLQAWRKVAPQKTSDLGFQMSPFFQEKYDYHRSGHSRLFNTLNNSYATSLNCSSPADINEVFLIDNPLIRQVIAREMPHPELDLTIDSNDKLSNLMDTLFNQAALYNDPSPPNDWIFIDISKLIPLSEDMNLRNNLKKISELLNKKLEEFKKNNPSQLEEINKLISKLQLIAFVEHKGQHVLVVPHDSFMQAKNTPSYSKNDYKESIGYYINELMIRSGYRINPSQAITALLKVNPSAQHCLDINELVAQARLVTGSEKLFAARPDQTHKFDKANETIPEVCTSWKDFVSDPVVKKFKALSEDENAPPYLQILPEATVHLLEGFSKVEEKVGGINKHFEDRKINDILQTSYFLMHQAMHEALFRKEDFVSFNNCIEFIHQQIQNLLVFIAPYNETALSKAITTSLISGKNPIIPQGLEEPKIHLKASAMHSLSSIIASVEAEKGTNALNVAVLKDSYYESVGALEKAKTHKLSVLDGDVFNKNTTEALKSLNPQPIDLFLCEFHHNVSLTRQSYTPENVALQIKELFDQGLAAEKLTVAIDCTINLQQSDEVRNLLADETIQKLIQAGRLNIVLLRSAQKYDMLGMDNYYGGITTTFNNEASFRSFNTQMDDPNDQLKDLNYQGLAHLHTHAGSSLDKDRAAKMEAVQMLYNQLPEKMIFKEGTTNPLQISAIKDNKLVFLDLKFSKNLATSKAFLKRFKKFAEENELPLSMRASFGFVTTNLTSISVAKGETPKIRLNPGLEGKKILSTYAKFFHAIQKEIDRAVEEIKEKDPIIFDPLLAKRIENLVI